MKNSILNYRKIAALVLAVMLLGSAAAGYAHAAGPGGNLTYAAGQTELSAAEIYAQNVNSAVTVITTVTRNMFGYDTVSQGGGSGFIITEDGYLLTNYHVVDGADQITVEMYNGDSYEAELIGYDDSNDVAVLKIDASGLRPVIFGNSDETVVGEDVVAIGSPLGVLSFSLTKGVVSALDRDVTLSGHMRLRLIQTDCAINAGSSGGALFNMYGEVIGITNAKASGYGYGSAIESVTFAIPVNTVVDIVEDIMTKGEISTPYIGITINDVDENLLAYGIPQGANVLEVAEGSPAEESGLQKNDVITAANGSPIARSDDLVRFIRSCSVGDEVSLTVFRQGSTTELRIIVGENVKSAMPAKDTENPDNK